MREEYAQSMQRSAHMFRLVVGGALTLRAQLAEQIHYDGIGRVFKVAAGKVLRVGQQLFSFSHFSLALC
ncbi:putative phage protein [Bordetella avium 197N]|uniref:Phage protein n=1 Tax=Bordetella avium (strain 197N) TaxID=360910 RepID=Q2L2Y2_BORA1|nr:putative phage protein [Bordetella avium 197N]